ncbi:MAG: hypothetical protein EOP10_22110 [Proteobacteria bacterium]|nr:MAG: hypothetical protein EOP10_22110 [Pseudomonadota bacterium]
MSYLKALPFLVLMFSALSQSAHAEEESEEEVKTKKALPKVEISGFARSIFEAENFKDGEVFHEARVEFKTKRKRGLRADIELDFRTKSDDVQVNEALLDKKFDNGLRLKGGYDLKRFGLEYQENRLERPTIDRSYIYQRMDLFNYTGRETVVVLEKGGESELYHDWSLALSMSEAQNASFVGNYQTDLSPAVRYGYWLQVGTHRIQDGQVLALAMMNSLWHRDSEKLWQVEWVVGVDPNQTEYESVFDDDEKIYFSGINSLYGHYFFNDGEESVMGQAGLTAVGHNLSETKYNSLGCFLGVRYDLGTLRIALNAELIGTNSPIDLKKRTYDESSARMEFLFAF